ncbi:hypothetical protein HAX54_036782 [Datura stramonium]|uniref:Uncharacterized protein n=1 Tax=Datura stramonium TaxID=4076 RepID=A0ABS8RMB3_DATST|nr:hypothetical protein [Datura stramonium]
MVTIFSNVGMMTPIATSNRPSFPRFSSTAAAGKNINTGPPSVVVSKACLSTAGAMNGFHISPGRHIHEAL